MAKGTYEEGPLCDNIPANIAKNVGRLLAKWGNFEFRIQCLIWELTGMDETAARLATKSPTRIDQRLDLLRDLLKQHNLKIEEATYTQIMRSAKAVERMRDLAAHGPWVTYGGEYKVINFKGKIKDQTLEHQDRLVNPESFTVTHEGLARLIITADSLNSFAIRCAKDFRKLKSSPEKSQ